METWKWFYSIESTKILEQTNFLVFLHWLQITQLSLEKYAKFNQIESRNLKNYSSDQNEDTTKMLEVDIDMLQTTTKFLLIRFIIDIHYEPNSMLAWNALIVSREIPSLIESWKKKKIQEAFGERRHLHVCDLWHLIVTFSRQELLS